MSELIRIDDSNKKYKELYCRIKVVALRANSQNVRSAVLLMLILSGFVIATELFVVRSFYPDWIAEVEMIRNTLVLGAIFVIVFNELYIRIKSKRDSIKIKK